MGTESEKEWIYVCVYVYLNHFAVHLKQTRHCKSTISQYKIKIKFKKISVFFLSIKGNVPDPSCHVI